MTDDDLDPEYSENLRRINHVLLDLVSAVDVSDDAATMPEGWANHFAKELAEMEAIFMAVDDSTDPPTRSLNITPLVGAMAALLDLLIGSIAESRGADRLAVIATVREAIDLP